MNDHKRKQQEPTEQHPCPPKTLKKEPTSKTSPFTFIPIATTSTKKPAPRAPTSTSTPTAKTRADTLKNSISSTTTTSLTYPASTAAVATLPPLSPPPKTIATPTTAKTLTTTTTTTIPSTPPQTTIATHTTVTHYTDLSAPNPTIHTPPSATASTATTPTNTPTSPPPTTTTEPAIAPNTTSERKHIIKLATNTPNFSRSTKEENKRLKQIGHIKISLHGTEVYTEQELICFLKRIRAKKVTRVGTNLIQAEILTGTFTHASTQTGTLEEVGPIYDQATQATPKLISEAHNVPIPELTINTEILITAPKPKNVVFNKRAFINYSRYPIPEETAIIASMGPKFAVPIYNSAKDFEALRDSAYLLNDMYGHPLEHSKIRSNIEEFISNYQAKEHHKYDTTTKEYFHKALEVTKAFFKSHPDLIATQSDKSRASIIMDKDTYINKVENLLKDKDTYCPLTTTSTRAYMKMNQLLLERMAKHKLINKNELANAVRDEIKPANLYGLIKNHKTGNPIRPIVNTRNSMGYLAAEKATEILTKARDTGEKYNVLNSRQACEIIRHKKIMPDEQLYSFDIISMFTNITAERAITAVEKRQKKLKLNNDTMALIIDIIKFVCLKSTEIRFNNKIYKQTKGLRMGSSLSSILADFVVEDMLDSALPKINKPKMLIKYVDDILCIMETKEALNTLSSLNTCDPHIKFEMETETNGRINYLDVTIYRDEYELKTKWFQKHQSSGQFLNYHSNHPKNNIWNTAVQYVTTMIMNSHHSHLEEISATALDRLTRNSYPENYAKRVIQKAKEEITISRTEGETSTKKESTHYTLGIEYIPGLTEKIQKEIKGSAARRGEYENIQTPAIPIHKMSKELYNKYKDTNTTFTIENLNPGTNIDLTQEEPQTTNPQPYNNL